MKKLAKYLLFLLLLPLLLSCESDDALDDGRRPQEHDLYIRLQLEVAGEKASRADINNPWGGEDGNGSWPGQANENRINTAALVFYKKSLNTVDDSDDTQSGLTAADKIEEVMFFNSDEFETQSGATRKTLKKLIPEGLNILKENYRMAALVNVAGSKADLEGLGIKKGVTLSTLRDFVIAGLPFSFGTTIAGFSNFAMTSVAETELTPATITETGIGSNVYTLPMVTVQRLAARIDISFGYDKAEDAINYNSEYVSNITIGGIPFHKVLVYDNTDSKYIFGGEETSNSYTGPGTIFRVYEGNGETYTTDEYYVIVGMEIVNGRTSNTYLFKRTTIGTGMASYPTSLTYSPATMEVFGTEECDGNKKALNWVVSPAVTTGTVSEGVAADKYNFLEAMGNAWLYYGLNALCTADRKLYRSTNGVSTTPYTYYALGYYAENTGTGYSYDSDMKFQMGTSNTTMVKPIGYYVTKSGSTYTYKSMPDYQIPVRHSNSTGKKSDWQDPMHFGIVRNNIYPIRIEKVINDRDLVIIRYYYYPGGSTKEYDGTATPFYKYIENGDDSGNGPSGTGSNAGYPNDAPQRR